jgi:hypothetical protein
MPADGIVVEPREVDVGPVKQLARYSRAPLRCFDLPVPSSPLFEMRVGLAKRVRVCSRPN